MWWNKQDQEKRESRRAKELHYLISITKREVLPTHDNLFKQNQERIPVMWYQIIETTTALYNSPGTQYAEREYVCLNIDWAMNTLSDGVKQNLKYFTQSVSGLLLVSWDCHQIISVFAAFLSPRGHFAHCTQPHTTKQRFVALILYQITDQNPAV